MPLGTRYLGPEGVWLEVIAVYATGYVVRALTGKFCGSYADRLLPW